MTPMFDKYRKMCDREWLNGREAILGEAAPNDHRKEHLETIPAGTPIICEFAGDFGMYAMADVGGVIHRVKIEVEHLHKVQFADE